MTSTLLRPFSAWIVVLALGAVVPMELDAGAQRRPVERRQNEERRQSERRTAEPVERRPVERRAIERRQEERRVERRTVPASGSARVGQARAATGTRLASARERLAGRLPGPKYKESRFDVRNPRSGKMLRTEIYTSFENRRFTNRQLEKNETMYRYYGTNNGRKVSWLTNKRYRNEAEMRRDLALKKEWGEITRVATYNVPKGTWVSEGRAASQGRGYEGGGYQATIASVPRAWKVREDRAFRE
jgi:hypothetical protein